jgi:glycine/D-amino acid oxidase-like deaminating enzyme
MCGHGGLHVLELDGGYSDPVDALQDLLTTLHDIGVEVRFRAGVTGIETHGGAVLGVTLANGERIACGRIVNAAGPWCNDIFSYVSLDCHRPLKPARIQVVHFDRPEEIVDDIPVAVDPLSGIYFRSQSRGQDLIVGSILEEDEREAIERPDDYARFVEDDFAQTKLHAQQHKVRALSIRGKVRGYSGLNTINATDVHPVVGKTAVRGFYVAHGCSSHGFKLAPAIGSLIAQEIAGKGGAFDTDVSPAFLAFDRPPIAIASQSVLA